MSILCHSVTEIFFDSYKFVICDLNKFTYQFSSTHTTLLLLENYSIRLIVLKSPHSVAFAFFSISTTIDLLKSSGHSPLLYCIAIQVPLLLFLQGFLSFLLRCYQFQCSFCFSFL